MIQSKAFLFASVFAIGLAFTPRAFAGELHVAVKSGDISRVRTALASGGDVNALDVDWSALHLAAQNNQGKIAQLLMKHGAKIVSRNSGDKTPGHPVDVG